ncbi:aldolase/citrate lyase family protein [Flavonifractor plautii]|nr:aldolase/citrate lyase family protein [Flavonifractor plautii]
MHAANENCLTIAQCESIEGLENVEKIAAMPGLDAIFIGTGDLSLEMGIAFKADSSASHTVDDPRLWPPSTGCWPPAGKTTSSPASSPPARRTLPGGSARASSSSPV